MNRKKKTDMKAETTTKISKIEHIKSLIASKGITKAKVAERTGITPSTLSKVLAGETDRLRGSKIDRIVEYLEAVNTNEV